MIKQLVFSNLEAKKHHILSAMNTNQKRKNNQLSETSATFFSKKHKSRQYQADFTVYDGTMQCQNGVVYPLLFSMLSLNGTSNSRGRIDLVQRYISLFGRDTIDCLLADLEFAGQNLKPIRILKHGRNFRYGLDIVTEFLTRKRNDYNIAIFKFLPPENLIFTPV